MQVRPVAAQPRISASSRCQNPRPARRMWVRSFNIMVKKSSEAGKKSRTRKLHAAGRRPAKLRPVRWVESDEPSDDLRHGVQFLHDELPSGHTVAFVNDFGWLHQPGGPATVRLLRLGPTWMTVDHWADIIETAREAVLVFLSSKDNVNGSFRHGPIYQL